MSRAIIFNNWVMDRIAGGRDKIFYVMPDEIKSIERVLPKREGANPPYECVFSIHGEEKDFLIRMNVWCFLGKIINTENYKEHMIVIEYRNHYKKNGKEYSAGWLARFEEINKTIEKIEERR